MKPGGREVGWIWLDGQDQKYFNPGPLLAWFRNDSNDNNQWLKSGKHVNATHNKSQSPNISCLMFITGHEYVYTQLLYSRKQDTLYMQKPVQIIYLP